MPPAVGKASRDGVDFLCDERKRSIDSSMGRIDSETDEVGGGESSDGQGRIWRTRTEVSISFDGDEEGERRWGGAERTLSLLRRVESVERRSDDLEDRTLEVDDRLSTRSEDVVLVSSSARVTDRRDA